MFDCPEAYPGYNESIRLEEYETIKEKINSKYKTNSTALQIRSEFEEAFNKLFDSMLEEYSDRIFDVIYVLMDCFNINEIKAYRYLSKSNKEKVRNFAKGRYHTGYYERLERDKMKKNAEKKGQSFFEYETIDDIFE
jgi:hypothetical protein